MIKPRLLDQVQDAIRRPIMADLIGPTLAWACRHRRCRLPKKLLTLLLSLLTAFEDV